MTAAVVVVADRDHRAVNPGRTDSLSTAGLVGRVTCATGTESPGLGATGQSAVAALGYSGRAAFRLLCFDEPPPRHAVRGVAVACPRIGLTVKPIDRKTVVFYLRKRTPFRPGLFLCEHHIPHSASTSTIGAATMMA